MGENMAMEQEGKSPIERENILYCAKIIIGNSLLIIGGLWLSIIRTHIYD